MAWFWPVSLAVDCVLEYIPIEVVRIDVQLAITLKWGRTETAFVRSAVQAMLDNTTPTTSPSMHVDT